MSTSRYLILVVVLSLVMLGLVAATNARLDPYGLAQAASLSDEDRGIKRERPGAFVRKASHAYALRPRAIILGTSRAQGALDVRHLGFVPDDAPVMNLALGALSIEQMRLLLMHAHAISAPRKAIIGLDLESFLGRGRPDFDSAALAGNPDSEPRWLVRVRASLSRHALAAGLAASTGIGRPDERPGFDDMLKELDGQRGVVWVTEFNNFYAQLAQLFPQSDMGNVWQADAKLKAAMEAFRSLLRFARAHDIDLRLFISPVHARYLDWYRHVGWWPMFQQWKRELVAAIAEDAQAHPGAQPVPLWDFSGFHPVATETVPRLGDLDTRMHWYLESSHYSSATGKLILDHVLGYGRSAESSPLPNQRIHRGNIDMHLARLSMDAERYRIAAPGEARNVREMVGYLRRFARR